MRNKLFCSVPSDFWNTDPADELLRFLGRNPEWKA
jgi:hypothetical protein